MPNDYETPKNIQATDLATMASTERRRIAKEQYQALLPTLYEAAKMGSPSVVISCRKTVDIVSRVIRLFSKHLFDNNKIHRVLVAKDELTIDLVQDTTVVHEYVNPLHEDLLDDVVAAPVVPESVASTFRRLSRRLETRLHASAAAGLPAQHLLVRCQHHHVPCQHGRLPLKAFFFQT